MNNHQQRRDFIESTSTKSDCVLINVDGVDDNYQMMMNTNRIPNIFSFNDKFGECVFYFI